MRRKAVEVASEAATGVVREVDECRELIVYSSLLTTFATAAHTFECQSSSPTCSGNPLNERP